MALIELSEDEMSAVAQALDGLVIQMSLKGAATLLAVRTKLMQGLARQGTEGVKMAKDAIDPTPIRSGMVPATAAELDALAEAGAFRADIPYTPRMAKTNGHDPLMIDGKRI